MNVISFSLFGTAEMYHVGAVENARICAELYPGWVCRFYVGDSVPRQIIDELQALGADVDLQEGHHESWGAMLWRFETICDDTVDRHMFRDADSRPDERERDAVDEWVTSGREFQFMRDHPEHGMPILGGMWGCTRAGARRIRHLLPGGVDGGYQVDQVWLRDHVYPIAVDRALIHSSPESPRFDDDRRGDLRDWPTPRTPGRFVGQGFNSDDSLRIPADAMRV